MTNADVVVGTTKTRKNYSASNFAAGRAILLLPLLLISSLVAAVGADDDPRTIEGLGKRDNESNITSIGIDKFDMDILNDVTARRLKTAKSIIDFPFPKSRIRYMTNVKDLPECAKGIVYWMYRDQRVQDNWALLYAQKLAIMKEIPLHVIFCKPNPYRETSLRQHVFMIEGLKEVQDELRQLNIYFHFSYGRAADIITDFAIKYNMGGIVLDFLPLREYSRTAMNIATTFRYKFPVLMVDAHNIIPCKVHVLNKGLPEMSADTNKNYKGFLTEFPPVIRHPYNNSDPLPESISLDESHKYFKIDRGVSPVHDLKGGFKNSIIELENYLKNILRPSGEKNPYVFRFTYLSPWLHFGQISAQRLVFELNLFSQKYSKSVGGFVSEVHKRRERADLYCLTRPKNYDRLNGAPKWALRSLDEHRKGKRATLLSVNELENARTNDPLWNSVQIQMVIEGSTHRLLRNYWTKKVLQWAKGPEVALTIAIHLNNKYSLDGHDPVIYNSCMFALCAYRFSENDSKSLPKLNYSNLPWYESGFEIERFIKKYNATLLEQYDVKYRRKF